MSEYTCKTCGKKFARNDKINSNIAEALGRNTKIICYDCALNEITKGHAPGKGDFNSALLISGEISDRDLGHLMDDLQAVEEGRFVANSTDDDTDDDYQDPAWCETCNKDTAFCVCTICPKCGEYQEDCRCEEKTSLQ